MSHRHEPENPCLWQEVLSAGLSDEARLLIERVIVLEKTASTQTECRRLCNGHSGVLVTTLRQTAGRGRLGRLWADDQGQGVALTLAVPAQAPERLSIASAVAVCEAAERFAQRPLGIRWPNDVMVDDRKLAGVLIEQYSGVALIGVGLNVNQTDWPADLVKTAVSLRDVAGSAVDRCRVVAEVLERLTASLSKTSGELVASFNRRDVLVGTSRTFVHGGERITGSVRSIDPLEGLLIETAHGARSLPAATTSLVHTSA